MISNLDKLIFSNGLIPAIIQDHHSKDVLMLAYMNRESLDLSLRTGETHFWSRSRKKIWHKGKTSGHFQKIKSIFVDCDQDTLIIEVSQTGVACHTGKRTCFFKKMRADGLLEEVPSLDHQSPSAKTSILESLSQTIFKRKKQPSKKSYTTQLLEGGIDCILKKVGEESAELIISAKNTDKEEIVHETADLFYHLLVTLAYHDVPFHAVEDELAKRTRQTGLEEKQSRENS